MAAPNYNNLQLHCGKTTAFSSTDSVHIHVKRLKYSFPFSKSMAAPNYNNLQLHCGKTTAFSSTDSVHIHQQICICLVCTHLHWFFPRFSHESICSEHIKSKYF